MDENEIREYVNQLIKAREPAQGFARIDLSEQQKKEQDEYIKENNLPF